MPRTAHATLAKLRGPRAGFVHVIETMLTIRMEFTDFDDYWRPMMAGQGTHPEFFAGLPVHTRERIEAAVRGAYLCGRPDNAARSSPGWVIARSVKGRTHLPWPPSGPVADQRRTVQPEGRFFSRARS